jgi:hypothetical protein
LVLKIEKVTALDDLIRSAAEAEERITLVRPSEIDFRGAPYLIEEITHGAAIVLAHQNTGLIAALHALIDDASDAYGFIEKVLKAYTKRAGLSADTIADQAGRELFQAALIGGHFTRHCKIREPRIEGAFKEIVVSQYFNLARRYHEALLSAGISTLYEPGNPLETKKVFVKPDGSIYYTGECIGANALPETMSLEKYYGEVISLREKTKGT